MSKAKNSLWAEDLGQYWRQGDAERYHIYLAAEYVALESVNIPTKAVRPAEMLFCSGDKRPESGGHDRE